MRVRACMCAQVPCDASPLAMLGGADVDRLPTASTCYNMLKLPNYRSTRALTIASSVLILSTMPSGCCP